MANKIYWSKTALIGGTADALDSIDGAGLTDGDFAHVVADGKIYIYKLDDDSGATESSPGVITPDANAGTKRWILAGERTTEVTEYCDTADLEKLHDITVSATQINTIGKIKARAYRNAAQSIAGTTLEKILIDTIDFDTENVVDVTTNNRIIPNLAGYYQVSGNARLGSIPDNETFYCSIFKNGERVSAGAYFRSGSTGQGISTVSDLVYMNGTTDYLEIYIYHSYSSALPLAVGQSYQNYISVVGPF